MVEECLKPLTADMDRFDRAKRIDWLDLDAISGARVLMVGAGAIGNETGKDLMLAGFSHVTVVDMDHVVGSNLARCIFFGEEDAEGHRPKAEVVAGGMSRLNPDAVVKYVQGSIQEQGGDFVASFDLVLGCLDNLLARLHLNAQCRHHGVPYVDGAMDSFRGKVQVVMPGTGPCLECVTNLSHARIVEQRFSCTGKDVSLFVPRVAAEITTTSIVGAVMVREAMKIASGRHDMLLDCVMYYDGQRNSMETFNIPVREGCPHHRTGE